MNIERNSQFTISVASFREKVENFNAEDVNTLALNSSIQIDKNKAEILLGVFENDSNGEITSDEFVNHIKELTPEQIRALDENFNVQTQTTDSGDTMLSEEEINDIWDMSLKIADPEIRSREDSKFEDKNIEATPINYDSSSVQGAKFEDIKSAAFYGYNK